MSMSGSGDKPLEIQSLTVFPRGDQHHTGVVFYRLFSDELSAANVRELLATIAEIYAQNGPFVVRYGFRKEGEDQFWVGLNHSSCGTTFEGMLRALARGRRIRVSRAFHLPGDNPNPELKPVLPVDQVVRLHAKHNGNDVTNAASMVAPQPRRAEPAEPVRSDEGRSPRAEWYRHRSALPPRSSWPPRSRGPARAAVTTMDGAPQDEARQPSLRTPPVGRDVFCPSPYFPPYLRGICRSCRKIFAFIV
jgi:hypothetical protein